MAKSGRRRKGNPIEDAFNQTLERPNRKPNRKIGDKPTDFGKGVKEGLGLEKEERLLVIPNRMMALLTACLAEALGSFMLILFVSLTIASIGIAPAGSRVSNGLTYGTVFFFFHGILSHFSGGHFNPATSFGIFFGYWLSPNLKGEYFKNGWTKLGYGTLYLVCYTVCQVLFSFFAGWSVEMVLKGSATGLGVPVIPPPPITEERFAFFMEVMASFVITLAYFFLVMEKRKGHMDSLILGAGIVGFYLACAPISGGSFNPLRYMGPAIADLPNFSWRNSWVFIVAPYVGSSGAFLVYQVVRSVLVPTKQYVGWVPMLMGPKSRAVMAHYIVSKKGEKQFIRM